MIGPLCHGLSDPIECDVMIVPPIIGLNRYCLPFAVFWGIALIGIFSFYTMVRAWLLSHIGQKVLKALPS